MSRIEPRNVNCPECGGDRNHILTAVRPDSTPKTEDCKLCGGLGKVTASLATEYALEAYEKIRRNLRERHAND